MIERMESVFLAIDCGNSRLKLTLFKGNTLMDTTVLDSSDIEGVLLYMERYEVESVAMVSVGRTDVRMVETVRQAVDDRFMLLTHNTPLPISIGYETPQTLGLDRVAAAAGARSLYPGRECVVVDAGTALTIDLLTEDGTFAGGTISPGIAMQFKALHEGTNLLPEVTVDDYREWMDKVAAGHSGMSRWPTNTRAAIAVGVVSGMIDTLCCSQRRDAVMIITGGDGEILYAQMLERERPAGAELVYSPQLVARGLKYIFDEYEEEI